MAIYKRCSRCGKRLGASQKCSCLKNRHKEYKKYRKDSKEEKFYSNNEWELFKGKMVEHYKGLDIYEYYINKKIVYGYTMHHIEELKDNWNRRVDPYNVIYLTESNHQKVHKAYKEGQKQKEEMQKLLCELIKRWNQEFGDVVLF